MARAVVHSQTGRLAAFEPLYEISPTGAIRLPVPDTPVTPISHWYLLRWDQERDGLALAEELWRATQLFVDQLIDAFEKSVPKRLRRARRMVT